MESANVAFKATLLDNKSYVELIHNNEKKLYQIAYLYVKNEHDALEIVDETVYKAYLSRKKLKNAEYFNTWITRILINTAIDYLRRGKKLLPLNEDIYKESTTNSSREELMDLYDAIDKLDSNCKTIVILKYYEGLSIDEISEVLNWSISKVKNYLHKSLVNLRIKLCEEGEI